MVQSRRMFNVGARPGIQEFFLLLWTTGKARAKENTYKWVSGNERLKAKTDGSKILAFYRIEINTEVQDKETIAQTRFWRLRPDDIAFRPPTESKEGIFCILEFKRMSDITHQYLIRVRSWAEKQYASLRRTLGGNDTTPSLASWANQLHTGIPLS